MGSLVIAGGESGESFELSLGYWRGELERVSKDCPQELFLVWLWWSVRLFINGQRTYEIRLPAICYRNRGIVWKRKSAQNSSDCYRTVRW